MLLSVNKVYIINFFVKFFDIKLRGIDNSIFFLLNSFFKVDLFSYNKILNSP